MYAIRSYYALAEDLRREVREMIVNNMTDDQIVEFLVARYGDS